MRAAIRYRPMMRWSKQSSFSRIHKKIQLSASKRQKMPMLLYRKHRLFANVENPTAQYSPNLLLCRRADRGRIPASFVLCLCYFVHLRYRASDEYGHVLFVGCCCIELQVFWACGRRKRSRFGKYRTKFLNDRCQHVRIDAGVAPPISA